MTAIKDGCTTSQAVLSVIIQATAIAKMKKGSKKAPIRGTILGLAKDRSEQLHVGGYCGIHWIMNGLGPAKTAIACQLFLSAEDC